MVGEREGGAEQPAARSGLVFIFPSSLPPNCVMRDKLDTSLGGPPAPPSSKVHCGPRPFPFLWGRACLKISVLAMQSCPWAPGVNKSDPSFSSPSFALSSLVGR